MECLMKKILFVIGTLLIVGLHPLNAGAITVVSTQDMQTSEPAPEVKQSGKVYLLKWQDNKLLTTKGTFMTNGIQIVNDSGIDKDKIAVQKKPPIIEFMKEHDKIVKIIILPNP